MKKNYLLVTLISTILVLLISSFAPIYAASRANTLTFTAGGGYYYFAQKRQIDNAAFPFIGLGYNFSDHWGFDSTLAQINTDSHSPEDDGEGVNGTLLLIDGVYHFTTCWQFFEPFVTFGVGVLGLDPNGSDAHNEGNINAGLGLNLFTDRVVAFRADARDIYTIVGGKNDVMLDFGVTFFLDLC